MSLDQLTPERRERALFYSEQIRAIFEAGAGPRIVRELITVPDEATEAPLVDQQAS